MGMRVSQLIERLQRMQQHEGDFHVYVMLRHGDDSESYYEIEGINALTTTSPVTFHCLMIEEEKGIDGNQYPELYDGAPMAAPPGTYDSLFDEDDEA